MIRTHGPQILQMNLTQPTLQLLIHSQIHRKSIRLEFALARKDRHDVTQCLVDGCPNGLEEEEEGNDGGDGAGFVVEAKGAIEFGGVEAKGEGVEGGACVELGDYEVGDGVAHFPVTEFVAEDGEDFFVLDLG